MYNSCENILFNHCYILAGSLTDSRLNSSDLTPYLRERITENINLLDSDSAISVLNTLTSRDILFFSNVDENIPEEADEKFYQSLFNAYQNGTILTAVYPDSGDIEILEYLLNEEYNLSEPASDDKDPHFEIMAIALRDLPDGNQHTFVYIDETDEDCGDMITSDDADFERFMDSPDIYSNDLGVSGDSTVDTPGDEIELTTEQVEKDLHESRVANFFAWVEGLESEVQSVAADVKSA